METSQTTTAVSPEESSGDVETSQAKRRKCDATDLSFLIVKNRNGQEQLFVDLGKSLVKNKLIVLQAGLKSRSQICFNCIADNRKNNANIHSLVL